MTDLQRARSRPLGECRAVRISLAICALLVCLASAAASAEGSHAPGCVWSPGADTKAVEALLDGWAGATHLGRFTQWDVSVDGGSTRVVLQFTPGALTLAWQLDDTCQLTGIAVDASSDYTGPRPDEDAVKQLVAGFRAVTTARPPEGHWPLEFRPVFAASGLMRLAMGGAAVVCVALLLVRRRWGAASVRLGRVPASTLIQSLGVIAIVALLPYQSPPAAGRFVGDWLHANSPVLLGVLPLMLFLWLAVSGVFGYAAPQRRDWAVLLPFLVGLLAAEAFTLHSIEEIELHFYTGYLPDKNSLVHPLFQMFMARLANDPYAFMLHVNGVIGALATVPLFLFVRHRTGSRPAALITGSFFALQPVVTRFAPTDGPYALIFLTWFSGLALLSSPRIGARQLFAGATLLAIAATCRMEGTLYLLASVLLLDLRGLFRSLNEHRVAAALSVGSVCALVGVHWWYCMPLHSTGSIVTLNPQLLPMDYLTWQNFRDAALGPARNGLLFRALIVVGALAGVVDRRLRIGLGAALGSFLVVIPMTQSTDSGILALHRLVPVCGLEAIAAGLGAFWITTVAPARLRNHWIVVAPGILAALYIFVVHRGELSTHYVFNDEFEILRRHLAPDGVPNTECALLFFGGRMDSDLHSARQVLPGMHVLDCRDDDCLAEAKRGGCTYYFRSVTCYWLPDVVPAACQARGMTADGDHLPCMEGECATLERALQLAPIAERTVYPHGVWRNGDMATRYPEEAGVGLYRVLGTSH